MKLKLRRRIVLVRNTRRTWQFTFVTLAGFCALSAKAQSVIAPPPSVSVTPPALQSGPNEMQIFSPVNPLSTFLDEAQPLQLGPVILRPHVYYQFTYGTGVQSSPGDPHDTITQSLSPGLLFVLTPRWTLDYTPTFTFYSDKNFQDNVGHSVTLSGGTTYGDWSYGLSQNFTYSSSPEVQTGAQTDQQTYSTSLSASHWLNSKVSLDLGLSQNLNFPSGFQSSKQWSTMDWLNYEFWPRLTAGVGAGAGYIDSSPNTVFEELQGRVNWRATDKISFGISGGAHFSQFTEGGADPLVNPIYGANIQYQPFDHTQITLSANQTVNTSYYQNQISQDTQVGASLSQGLFEKLYLGVSGGYDWQDNISAASGATANSSSDSYSVSVSLSTTFLKRGTVSAFYSYSENITTQTGLAYSSSQVGFNIGYKY
jgi:hypothetical protein